MSSFVRNTVLLSLLSIQVGMQPVLIHLFAKDVTNTSSKVGVIEVLKLMFAIVPLYSTNQCTKQFSPQNWSLTSALKTTFLPSLIYVLQNYLNQTAVVLLDGVTFNILNQTKIIWTAILVYVMLGKKQSTLQILALCLLMTSAIIMTTGGAAKAADKNDSMTEFDSINYYRGVVRATAGAVLSGFAGTIVQRALQVQKRNPYVVTIELSTFGLFALSVSSVFSGDAFVAEFWKGWTFLTFVTMVMQAVGGIIIGFVIKFCGNVKKSFAVVSGLVLTALLESFINNKPFGINGMIAVLLVVLSTYIYANNPPSQLLAKSSEKKSDKSGKLNRAMRLPSYNSDDCSISHRKLSPTVSYPISDESPNHRQEKNLI